MKRRALLACLLLLAAVACRAQSGSVAGDWRGIWTNAAGDVFSAKITLVQSAACKDCAVKGTASVEGKIVWMLRKVGPKASPEDAVKIGTVLTEQEDVDALIRMEVEQRHKNGERHNDLLCRLCSAPSLGADDAKT